MNDISWNYFCSDPEKILFETSSLLDRQQQRRNIILEYQHLGNDNKILDLIALLADNIAEFNSFHNLCCLMKYVCPSDVMRQSWNKADSVLNTFYEKTKYDQMLYNTIKNIKSTSNVKLDPESELFLNKIIEMYEKHGCHKSNNIMEKIKRIKHKIEVNTSGDINDVNLLKLIKCRNEYAKLLNYENYFDMNSDIDIDELKMILKKIMANLNDATNASTIINLENVFNLDNSFNVILCVISNMFQIKFILDDNVNVNMWHKDVKLYKIYNINDKNNDKIIGYVYVDLKMRKGKCADPTSISLCDACMYPLNSNVIRTPIAVLFGNLKNSINYIDIIKIFKEFGNIVHMVFHRSKFGMINIEKNMSHFMNMLFEQIIYDDDIIATFNNNNPLLGEILNKNKTVFLKCKCAMILFDYIIHSSSDSFKSNNDLIAKFKEISNSVFSNSSNQKIYPVNNINNIPKDVINYLIYDGSTIYTHILNDLMAHSVYTLIKKNNSMTNFVKDVMAENISPLKITINKFTTNCLKNKISVDNNSRKEKPDNNVIDIKENKSKILIKKDKIKKINKINEYSAKTNYFTDN